MQETNHRTPCRRRGASIGQSRRRPAAQHPRSPATPDGLDWVLALQALIADPRSGVTGVTVVGAPPSLVAALRKGAGGAAAGSAS
jgi:hypothetical protein